MGYNSSRGRYSKLWTRRTEQVLGLRKNYDFGLTLLVLGTQHTVLGGFESEIKKVMQ